MLLLGALQAVPNILQSTFEMLVSLDRVCRFLNNADIQPISDDPFSESLIFSDATITWPAPLDQEAEDHAKLFRLRELDLRLPKGKFTLVCGPLGAGKTLLVCQRRLSYIHTDRRQLRSLLGEAIVEKGYVAAPTSLPTATPLNGYALGSRWTLDTWLDDSVAYAPQQAYIRHGTVRDNILLGQPMWRARYDEALRQASLLSDLAIMAEGDLTEVGEHGVTLVSCHMEMPLLSLIQVRVAVNVRESTSPDVFTRELATCTWMTSYLPSMPIPLNTSTKNV